MDLELRRPRAAGPLTAYEAEEMRIPSGNNYSLYGLCRFVALTRSTVRFQEVAASVLSLTTRKEAEGDRLWDRSPMAPLRVVEISLVVVPNRSVQTGCRSFVRGGIP